ncbi:substrate-binding periplasmic protein [Niveispirillum sp. KHB5.9]|uniref:substrate-binding periplasmic protein n=1 Tax=Niveispirillum sp. KHB5.9 TaxID=3400269 RepID=UPI003A8BFD2E
MPPCPTRRQFLPLLAGLPAMVMAGRAQAGALVCGVLLSEPWVMQTGKEAGLGHDLVALLAREAGIAVTVLPAPQPRLMQALQSRQIDLMLFLQHRQLDEMAIGLVEVGQVDIGIMKARNFTPKGAADFVGRRVAHMRFGAAPTSLPEGTILVEVKDIHQGLAMLAAGRVDGCLGGNFGLEWQIRRYGFDRGLFGGFHLLRAEPLLFYAGARVAADPDLAGRLKAAAPAVAAAFPGLCARYLAQAGPGVPQAPRLESQSN